MRVECCECVGAVAPGEVRSRQAVSVDGLVLRVDGGDERVGLGHGRRAARTACEAAMLANVAAVVPARARVAAACSTETEEPTSVYAGAALGVGVASGDGTVPPRAPRCDRWAAWSGVPSAKDDSNVSSPARAAETAAASASGAAA